MPGFGQYIAQGPGDGILAVARIGNFKIICHQFLLGFIQHNHGPQALPENHLSLSQSEYLRGNRFLLIIYLTFGQTNGEKGEILGRYPFRAFACQADAGAHALGCKGSDNGNPWPCKPGNYNDQGDQQDPENSFYKLFHKREFNAMQ